MIGPRGCTGGFCSLRLLVPGQAWRCFEEERRPPAKPLSWNVNNDERFWGKLK